MTVRIRLASLAFAGAIAARAPAQEAPPLSLPRPSPSASLKQMVGLTEISVAYSSPGVKGSKIWGELVPYDVVWRAGANECTKVTFGTAVTFSGKAVSAGSYCLFLLPARTGFTLILSRDTSLWGTYGYKPENDVLRIPATTAAIPARERLAYEILDFNDDGGTLALEWETLRIGARFELATRETVLAAIRALHTDEWRPNASAARYLLEAKIQPDLAMELIDKSIRQKEDWSNVWIKARLLAAGGKKKEAAALAARAQELGKSAPNFPGDEVARALSRWRE